MRYSAGFSFFCLQLAQVTSFQGDNRLLNESQFCPMSAEIKCFLVDGRDCSEMDSFLPNECKPVDVTFEFEYCNFMIDQKINFIQEKTEIMIWNVVKNENTLDKSILAPLTCRKFITNETTDTCGERKGFNVSIKLEGWVDGYQDIEGNYCFNYQFLRIEIPRQPAPSPTKEPTLLHSYTPTSGLTSEHTDKPTKQLTLEPSKERSLTPSSKPSSVPSSIPTSTPTAMLTKQHSHLPSPVPSFEASFRPSVKASQIPSNIPSSQPSTLSSFQPTLLTLIEIVSSPSSVIVDNNSSNVPSM